MHCVSGIVSVDYCPPHWHCSRQAAKSALSSSCGNKTAIYLKPIRSSYFCFILSLIKPSALHAGRLAFKLSRAAVSVLWSRNVNTPALPPTATQKPISSRPIRRFL